MVKDFLNNLGVNILRQEGINQYVCTCPWCNGSKLYVNQTTGLWDCKKGCGNGNPYQMAEKLTTLDPKGILALLKDHGLLNNINQPETKQQPRKITLKASEVVTPTKQQLQQLCQAKQVNQDALSKFTPYAHTKNPLILLPAFNPENLKKACGWLRLRIDGQPIKRADGQTVKYPMVSGSRHGLFGVKWIMDKNPDTIVFCEAWRDALAVISLGFFATASSGGASTWRESWLPVFKNKVVYICMDADRAGTRAAKRAAEAIVKVAKETRTISLPYEIQDKHGKDLYDYITDGHDKTDFENLLKSSVPATAPPAPESNYIILDNDYPDTIAEAFEKWSIEICGVKHRHHVDTWTIFKDNRYKLVDESEIKKWIRKFCRCCKVKKKNFNIPLKVTTYLINSVTEALSALSQVWIRPRYTAPSWLNNSNSLPKDIIALENCLLDISNNESKQLKLTEEYYTLNYLSFAYGPQVECPNWIRFVESIFTTKKLSPHKSDFNEDTGDFEEGYETIPDQTSIQILQEFMGYLLSPDTSFQKILGIVGPKRSGKSTIGRIIRELVGRENVAAPALNTLTTEFGLQGLINKTVVIIGDANISSRNSDIMRAVERLKSISGEDAQQINRKNQKFLEVDKLNVRFIVIANELQNLIDPSGTLASRFIYLITTQSFYGHEDIFLFDKLKTELPGIFNWALKGLKHLRNRGFFLESEAGKEIKNDFTELTSPITAFVNECCVQGHYHKVMVDVLYYIYRKWCEENGRGKPSSQKFKNDFRGAFPDIPKVRYRLNSESSVPGTMLDELGTGTLKYFYQGIKLKPEWQNVTETWNK